MVDKKIYPIKQQFVSSFFPSLFLLGQTDVSPTRCWGKNLLLFTDTRAHFEAINKFAEVTQQKHSSSDRR